ncbi:hypothetical protein ACFQX6_49170 [Streptosporangium lutulentum]
MDSKASRVPPTINMIVFLVACAAFFLRHLGVGLSPDRVTSRPENDR